MDKKEHESGLDLIWNKVSKTAHSNTKPANTGGNMITAIDAHSQIMSATDLFGPYGQAWGFKEINLNYSLTESHDLLMIHAVFFYPGGMFPIINAKKMFKDNNKTKIDDDLAKKLETDTLTKALSKIGFNADVFLGLFDDNKYVQDRINEESEAKKEAEKPELLADQKEAWARAILSYLNSGNLDNVLKHVHISDENQTLIKEQANEQISSE